ncbi:hypothetical protein [Brevibacterium oceani]|uniref:hypothetical protein n=1 Tax=Brevibacterium oceani TaxID=358099 RepID=UPI0015E671C0|nr:hypothetical protein [Brevibacterium oceani]
MSVLPSKSPEKDLPVTRDGRFRVTESRWDCNGSFHVVVQDTRAASPGETVPPDVIERERRAVRDLARRVDRMGRVQWVRTDDVSVVRTDDGPRLEYRLTASRLDPSYR